MTPELELRGDIHLSLRNGLLIDFVHPTLIIVVLVEVVDGVAGRDLLI